MIACFVCRFFVDDDDANGCLLRGPTFMVTDLKSGHELKIGSTQLMKMMFMARLMFMARMLMKMMFMARMMTVEVNPGGQICTADSTCFPQTNIAVWCRKMKTKPFFLSKLWRSGERIA